MDEWRTYSVSLVSLDSPGEVDEFYKYRGDHLPEEGSRDPRRRQLQAADRSYADRLRRQNEHARPE